MKSPYPNIDKLRKKFDADKPLNIREVCFVLWAENFVCSSQYLAFSYWVRTNKLPWNISMKWKIWKSMFDSFAANDYLTMRDDLDLMVKIHKTELNRILKIKI